MNNLEKAAYRPPTIGEANTVAMEKSFRRWAGYHYSHYDPMGNVRYTFFVSLRIYEQLIQMQISRLLEEPENE